MKKNLLFLAVFAIVFIQSCTVEKRRYLDGYHVEWNHRHDKQTVLNEKTDLVQEEKVIEASPYEEENASSSKVEVPQVQVQPSNVTVAKLERNNDKQNRAQKPNKGKYHQTTARENVEHTTNVFAPKAELNFDASNQSDEEDLLLIILAIFIPPLAVFLHEGSWNTTCWINLILTLLFWLPGIIHALWVILR